MTEGRGGGKNCQNGGDVICGWPLMIFSKYIFWKYIVTHNIPSQEAIFFLPDDKAIAQNRQVGNFFKGGQKKLSIYDNRFFIIQSVHEDYHSIIFFHSFF